MVILCLILENVHNNFYFERVRTRLVGRRKLYDASNETEVLLYDFFLKPEASNKANQTKQTNGKSPKTSDAILFKEFYF